MTRALLKLIGLTLITAAATGGLWWWDYYFDERDRIIDEQRQQIEVLQNIATRLQADRRVADILVTEQSHDENGRLKTTLLFVEYDREGQPLPPRQFTLIGDTVHVETQLIKFERSFVREGDPLRGQSLALFTRIYGSATAPEEGQPIDPPGRTPSIYRGEDPKQTAFERELWDQFWRLTHDNAFAREKGVRVAQGETVWGIFKPDRLYTLELEAAGGLTLTNEPLKPIFREAFSAIRETITPESGLEGESPSE